jgi:hypothetical protein
VPLFRRREPLHERLAREGGLRGEPLAGPAPPPWMETGIHGVNRPREWDAVVTVEAEEVEGDRVQFVDPGDGTLVIELGEDVEPIAAALDGLAKAPYRAEAVRRGENQWAVGLRRVEVAELVDDPQGQELTLTMRDGERTLVVDGAPVFGSIPALEQRGAVCGESYVVQAHRLSGALWEVKALPL